jgi:hypothetical protein
MATTVFTSWASVRDFLLDRIAASDPSVGTVRVGNKEITYRPENLERMLAYAEQRAAQEQSGSAPTLQIGCHVLIFDFVLLGGEFCYPPGWGDISLTARTRSGTL